MMRKFQVIRTQKNANRQSMLSTESYTQFDEEMGSPGLSKPN